MGQRVSFRNQSILYYIAVMSITLDQYTKHLVRGSIEYGEIVIVHPVLRDIFDLTYTTNTGAAFGMFQSGGRVFAAVASVVVMAIMYFNLTLFGEQIWLRTALGLQMGGAVGNLIDRIRFGMVTDFLHLHYWPIFNVADSCITVGAVMLAVFMLREMRSERSGSSAQEGV